MPDRTDGTNGLVAQLGATHVADGFTSDGNGNQALNITSCAFSHWTADSTNSSDGGYDPMCANGQDATSESPDGQQNGLYLECKCSGGYLNPCAFEDTSSGAGSGQDAWYRLRVYFTPSYHPSPDSYKWFLERLTTTRAADATPRPSGLRPQTPHRRPAAPSKAPLRHRLMSAATMGQAPRLRCNTAAGRAVALRSSTRRCPRARSNLASDTTSSGT